MLNPGVVCVSTGASTLDLDEALLIEEISTGSDTCVRPLAYNESHYTHEGKLQLCDIAFLEA